VELHNLLELAITGGVIAAAALVKFGSWLEAKLHRAEARECRRIWFEDIKPCIHTSEQEWPPAGQAYAYLFGTRYDPAVDAAEYTARMEADVRRFLDNMKQS